LTKDALFTIAATTANWTACFYILPGHLRIPEVLLKVRAKNWQELKEHIRMARIQ
jgi:hypothetical protein